jgi:hypothetical protein
VAQLDAALLLYPAYYCLANAAIALLIVHRRPLVSARSAAPNAAA